MSEQRAASQMNTQAAQSGVLFKLMVFSVALGVLPLSSYYGSLNYVWDGNTIYAAITAVVAANIVLVSYIITAVLEDKNLASSDTKHVVPESKKEK